MEGLRILKRASAYGADALTDFEDEPAAPASVKRARIADRLGSRANSATASVKRIEFLDTINQE